MLTSVMSILVYYLVYILLQKYSIYKVLKLFKRKDVNMCPCFKIQVRTGYLPL